MQPKTVSTILDEYDGKSKLYEAYGLKLSVLVRELLEAAGIAVHSVAFRCKERESLRKKLGKTGARYSKLTDITDICGLRVITYFDDEVKKVSELLESEFSVDLENSSDKASSLDPDRFGYLSVHYVISNGEGRSILPEYRRFDGIKAEIQVRSILQHTWAEIEHDLGYKSRDGIPRAVRRRFSRLAGLLELADQEFRTIRDELASYSSEVLGEIKKAPEKVDLNSVSYKTFIETSDVVRRLDRAIANGGGCKLSEEYSDNCDHDLARLNFLGINSINDLDKALKQNENFIVDFSTRWLARAGDEDEDVGEGYFSPGIACFYLAYITVLRDENADAVRHYCQGFMHPDSLERANNLMVALLDVYGELVVEKGHAECVPPQKVSN